MATINVVRLERDGMRRLVPVKGAWESKKATVGQTVSRRKSGR